MGMARIAGRLRHGIWLAPLVVISLVAGARITAAATSTPLMTIHPLYVGAPGDGPNCTVTGTGWTCHITVGESSSSSGTLTWYAAGDVLAGGGLGGATFTPSSGTLQPGQKVTVKVVTHDCGGYAAWLFEAANNTGAAVLYSCG